MTNKEQFTSDVYKMIENFIKVKEKLPELYSSYFDNGFDSGGVNPIIDDDISAMFSLTANEVSNAISMIEQLQNFLNNAVVTVGDYSVILNKFKYGRK